MGQNYCNGVDEIRKCLIYRILHYMRSWEVRRTLHPKAEFDASNVMEDIIYQHICLEHIQLLPNYCGFHDRLKSTAHSCWLKPARLWMTNEMAQSLQKYVIVGHWLLRLLEEVHSSSQKWSHRIHCTNHCCGLTFSLLVIFFLLVSTDTAIELHEDWWKICALSVGNKLWHVPCS